ncbi:MAG: class I SAM-dependent methyltransferase [Pseudomonadota bacterium]
MSERIKDYWNQRAGENSGSLTATTQDIWLRRLEVASLIGMLEKLNLPPDAHIADMGCGDGNTILQLAQQFPDFQFSGFDYAPQMIATAQAQQTALGGLGGRVAFSVGDVNDPAASAGTEQLDVAMTDRCLINLETSDAQYAAIARIADCLKPGGVYLAIENFHEGQNAMNAARAVMGLPEIPIRWHNHFFHEPEFRARTAKIFSSLSFHEFSSAYYYATRIIYSAMCKMQGVAPDYDHEIHRLAVQLPPMGNFSPIRMAILRKAG